MFLLTCHVCSCTGDRSQLEDLEQEFLTDPANTHLFSVLEDPESQPKPAKKRKSAAKAGGAM